MKKNNMNRAGRRLAFGLLASGLGASLFSPPTCDVRFKNSVIEGTETFLYATFLNPELIVEALLQASGQPSNE